MADCLFVRFVFYSYLRGRVVLLAVLLAMGARASAAQPAEGLSSFAVLQMESSARAAALSGAFSAVYDGDAGALFYSPALLSPETHGAVSLSYLNHLSDINAGFLAYGHDLERWGTLGAGLRFLSYGALEGYDENGLEEGAFRAGDAVLTLGWARALGEGLFGGRLRGGVNLHAAYSGIASARATVLAADAGLLYRFPRQQLVLSASVRNLGAALSRYAEADLALPVDVRLALTKRLRHLPLLLSVGGYNLDDVGASPSEAAALDRVLRHLALGAEMRPVEAFAARLGYSHRRHLALREEAERLDPAGLSAGFGLRVAQFGFDYAFSSWSALGGLHHFTLRARLGGGAVAEAP